VLTCAALAGSTRVVTELRAAACSPQLSDSGLTHTVAVLCCCVVPQAYVSTGGAIERVLAAGAGPRDVPSYLDAVKVRPTRGTVEAGGCICSHLCF
jgi:hypothetical protein